MKAHIAETEVERTTVARIDVGQLGAGPLQIGRLVLGGSRIEASTGQARIHDLRVTVGLAFRLTWQVEVTIPFAGTWTWGDTNDLGSHEVTVGLGDLELPGLESFSLDVEEIEAAGVQAVIEPLRNLQLGPLVAEQLAVRDVVAPVVDVGLLGLTLGRIAVSGLTVPGASAGHLRVGRVSGPAIPLGTVSLPGVSVPAVAVSDIASKGLDTAATGRALQIPVDAGVLELTLAVVPSARVQAAELRLANLHANAALGAVELHDVQLPWEVLDLTLAEIGVETLELPKLEVS